MSTILPPSMSTPSLPSLEAFPRSSSAGSAAQPPFLAYSSSVSNMADSPPPSPSSLHTPLRSVVYIQCGQSTHTGLLASLHSLVFVLAPSRALPTAAAAQRSAATVGYKSDESVRLSLDPALFFLTSPSSSLDFTACALSRDSYAALEAAGRLHDAWELSAHATRAELHRHCSLSIYQHPVYSAVSVLPGYLLSLFDGWCAYSAPCNAVCSGGVIATGDGDLVGLHRGRNDSRRWCEGTLIADVLPVLSPYLVSVKAKAAGKSWIPHWILPTHTPPSPERTVRTLTPPASPKGEALLMASDKRRVDRIALVFVLLFLSYWVGEFAVSRWSGAGEVSDDRWMVKGVGLGVIVLAHVVAYAGWRRWKSG